MIRKKWLLILKIIKERVLVLILVPFLIIGCAGLDATLDATLDTGLVSGQVSGQVNNLDDDTGSNLAHNNLVNQGRIDTRAFMTEEYVNRGINESTVIAGGNAYGGIVPHHDAAYQIMADFYVALGVGAIANQASSQDNRQDVNHNNIQADNETGKFVDVIVLIGPNHFGTNDGVITYNGTFETYMGDVEPATDIITELVDRNIASTHNKHIFETEHSLNMQMAYIAYYFPDATLVPIMI
ncbi:MAG: AmmeMemoRadiSam system protein B, partial [Vallitaleaceae bacterium]|nr:AmmeMemoRadiSam system protein B [Vallitaleaceae bacterium]